MKLTAVAVLVLAMIVLAIPAASHAFPHSRVIIGVGPVWGPPAPWWYHRPVYVYAPPPPVVVQEPPVYVQQSQPAAGAAWYYCPSARSYYPSVQTCGEPWVPVAPRPQ